LHVTFIASNFAAAAPFASGFAAIVNGRLPLAASPIKVRVPRIPVRRMTFEMPSWGAEWSASRRKSE
jgi:hypothetical protein